MKAAFVQDGPLVACRQWPATARGTLQVPDRFRTAQGGPCWSDRTLGPLSPGL